MIFDQVDWGSAGNDSPSFYKRLQAFTRVSAMVARQEHSEEVLAEACRLIALDDDIALTWIGRCDTDGRQHVMALAGAARGYGEGPEIRWDDTELGRGPSGTAARDGRTVVLADLESESFAPWRARARAHGVRSVVCVPLYANATLYGTLNLYARTPASFDPASIRLIEDLAAMLGFALALDAQRRAESALRSSEARYKLLFEHNPHPMWVVDLQTLRLIDANDAMSRRYGYTHDELVGMHIRDLRPPEDWPKLEARFEVLPPHVPANEVWRHRTKNGESFLVTVDSRRITFEGRDALFALATDVTAREEARKALEASEARAEAAFHASPDALGILEASTGRLLRVNEAFANLMGRPRKELTGRTDLELQLWVHSAERRRFFDEVTTPGRVRLFSATMRTLSGRAFAASISAEVTEYDGVAALVTTIRDVSVVRELQAERDRLLAAIEHMDDCLIVTNRGGTIVYVNPAFERTSGWSRAEALGETPRILKSGQHPAAHYDALWSTLAAGRVFHGAFVNRRKNGELYEVEASISPVLGADGRVTHYVAVQHDVTARHALEGQLRHALKMEAVGRLAGGVAHDFNNILTAIRTSAHFLLEDLPAPDARREDARVIAESAGRASALTRQLLAFSRRETATVAPVDLNALVTSLAKMLGRLLREDAKLDVRPARTPPTVLADAGHLEQIVVNLVVNAGEALTGPGEIVVELTLAPPETGDTVAPLGRVSLEVRDTGCGMDEETRARVFEPFFTTKERGTGLGLATVYGLVTQMGGTLVVESTLGRGSVFRAALPLCEPTPAVNKPPAVPPRASQSRRVLVLEDDVAVRSLLARALRQSGYDVSLVATCAEARALADASPEAFDLLVSDVVLPDGDGRALTDELQSRSPGLRAVLMSGYSDQPIDLDAFARRGHVFLQKPFDPPALLRAIATLA